MKKTIIFVCTILLSVMACIASNSEANAAVSATAEVSSSRVSVPTGVFFSGSNFIKVESTWVRIVVNGEMSEYDFHAEMDPSGNYVLTFGRGECITIYSNGRSLYYNGTTYSKK